MRFSMKKCALGVAAAFVVGAGASSAYAASSKITIGLQEVGYFGNAVVTVAGPSAAFAQFGGVGLNPWGSFSNLAVTASGYPNLAPPQLFDTTTLNVSAGNAGVHTLNVFITSQDNTNPLPNALGNLGFVSGLSVNSLLTAGWSVTESVYLDTTNQLFSAPTLLATATFAQPGPIWSTNIPSMQNMGAGYAGPYSITQWYAISTAGTGQASSSINVAAAIPEPETYAMMLAGLGLMGFIARRRKKNAVA